MYKIKILLFYLLVVVLFGSLTACHKSKVETTKIDYSFQSESYAADWAAVKKMEKDGLGKAIIEKTNDILNRAIKENNANQIFKALAYRSKYIGQIEEDSQLKIITVFEKQIARSTAPLKQLLYSATAEIYDQYYQQNRWRFQQRSETQTFDEGDIRSWSLAHLQQQIVKHYQNSLNGKEDLLATPLTNFKDILHFPDTSLLALQPSLYSFLASRALNYFQRDEGDIYSIDQELKQQKTLFLPAEDFIKLNFSTVDSLSNNWNSIRIYQEIINADIHQENKALAVFDDLNRLQFVYQLSECADKEELYLDALNYLEQDYQDENLHPIWLAKANLYFQWGNNKNIKPKETKDALKKAVELCDKMKGENSFSAQKAAVLKASILRKTFRVNNAQLGIPNEEFALDIQYRNQVKLYFRLYKTAYAAELKKDRYQANETLIDSLSQKQVFRNWTITLPQFGDFQSHDYTSKIESLPKGNFVLFISADSTFDYKKTKMGITHFQMSDLAYFDRDHGANIELYIRQRKSGLVAKNAKIQLLNRNYDKNKRQVEWQNGSTISADKEGYVTGIKRENKAYRFYIFEKDDTLMTESGYRYYYPPAEKKVQINTHFFTDRAIYRPGQSVHFKGIVIEKEGEKRKLKTNEKQKIKLFNTNGEEISSLDVASNDFGSFHGTFTLPKGGLNGKYRIQDQHGSIYFSVEEYKRPTFEVLLDSNKNTKLNQQVEINGAVKTYAGAFLGGTKIKYLIVRNSHYPIWGFYRPYFPVSPTKEIANGEVQADENGRFSFSFLAEAPLTSTELNAIYNYEINVEATAANGEVQGINKSISVSKKALFLSTNLDEFVTQKELEQLVISAKDIQGKEIHSSVKLQIIQLKSAEKEETPLDSLKKGIEIVSQTIECNQTFKWEQELKEGTYLLVTNGTDRFGEKVEMEQRFVLYDENSNQLPLYQKLWFQPLTSKAEVGKEYSFLLGSSLKNLQLLYEVEQNGKIIHHEWIQFSNEQRKVTIPITEKYRGGFSIHLVAIKNNELLRKTQQLFVPYENKQLTLTLGTYRDLVKPGSQEKWTLNIKGPEANKVEAEVLLGMYDQSLDVFAERKWSMDLYDRQLSNGLSWQFNSSFSSTYARQFGRNSERHFSVSNRQFPSLNWFGFYMGGNRYYGYGMPMLSQSVERKSDVEMESAVGNVVEKREKETDSKPKPKEETKELKSVPLRKDFRETAFFYPAKYNKEDGSLQFEFTVPDALTQWKFRAFAHTKNLEIGQMEYSIRSQKELMVMPNLPRYFREGDQFYFSSMINNLSNQQQNGSLSLRFFNAIDGNPIDLFVGESGKQDFTIKSNGNTQKSWEIKIPEGIKAIRYQLIAKGQTFSDGQEGVIPVLSQKQLVTESLPMPIRAKQEKKFSFKNLLNASQNKIVPTSFSIELTANPAWYAVQALPTLNHPDSKNAQAIFYQIFANSIAQKIIQDNPKIKEVFDLWRDLNSDELLSKLEQNQELKDFLIEETPWLKEAKSETEQKRRIALLFEANQMAESIGQAVQQLISLQLPDGAWPWFKGMRSNQYITASIVEGFGQLHQMGIRFQEENKIQQTVKEALVFLDEKVLKDYQDYIKKAADKKGPHLSALTVQYLYLRSFYPDITLKDKTAFNHYLSQADEDWKNQPLLIKAKLAIAIHRLNPKSKADEQIMTSVKDFSIQDEEMGMYWKNNTGGWSWSTAKIESQAMMIAAFKEVTNDKQAVEEMKIWLLKQKQTQAWESNQATAMAVYALLMQGDNLLESSGSLSLQLGDQQLNTSNSTTPGTGYITKSWKGNEIKPKMGEMILKNEGNSIAWGAAYLQYYKNRDEIEEMSQSGIKVSKTLFKVNHSENGKIAQPIDKATLKVGDRLLIRLRIESDRDLEFVHLKDQEAAAFEPVSTLSSYRSQDGLYYYQSVSDAATNFFFENLPKGVFVFEYEMKVTQQGDFGNGPASLQSYYAPEFKAYSKGRRVKIWEN